MNEPSTKSFPAVVFVTVRNRPVRLEHGSFGWSAHAVERGYFPISSTGYRSFASGPAPLSPPSLEYLETHAQEQDKAHAETLKAARAALRSRFSTGPGQSVSAFIHLSGLATQALEAGFFAPDSLRPSLWEVAYQLLQRIAHDPVIRPSPEGEAEAWNAEQCHKAHVGSVRALADLTRFMNGDLTRPINPDHRFRIMSSYFNLPSRAEVVLPIPAFDLGVYPDPIAADLIDAVLPDEDEDGDDGDTEPTEAECLASDQLTFL